MLPHEASPEEAQASTGFSSGSAQRQKAVSIARKHAHDYAFASREHEPREFPTYIPLGDRTVECIDVGAVTEQQPNSLVAQLPNSNLIGGPPSWLLGIEVEVGGMEYDASTGAYRERCGIHD